MNQHLDPEMVVGFISEAKGYLPEIMLGLESFAGAPHETEKIREAFRYSHIIRGAASMLGLHEICEVSYQMEVTLEMLSEGRGQLSQELLEELCQQVSDVAGLLDQALAIVEDCPPAVVTETAELPFPVFSLDLPEPFETDHTKEGFQSLSETHHVLEEIPEDAFGINEEEPVLSAFDEQDFSVSLPETEETPTIGDLDLTLVAQDFKELFGEEPPIQPEFEIPKELLSSLPEINLPAVSETITSEESLLELPAHLYPEPETGNLAENLVDDLLAHASSAQTNIEPTPDPIEAGSRAEIVHESQSEGSEAAEEPELCAVALRLEESLAITGDETPSEALLEDIHAPAAEPPVEGISSPAARTKEEKSFAFYEGEQTASEVEPDAFLPPSIPTFDFDDSPLENPEQFSAPIFSETAPAVAITSERDNFSEGASDELMETFLLEAEEHLQTMDEALRVLEKEPHQREALQELRRSAHSLKGTAAMMGLDQITQLAHRMEDLLDLVFEGDLNLTPSLTHLLQASTDALEDLSNGNTDETRISLIYDEYQRVLTSTHRAKATDQEAHLWDSEPITKARRTAPLEEQSDITLPDVESQIVLEPHAFPDFDFTSFGAFDSESVLLPADVEKLPEPENISETAPLLVEAPVPAMEADPVIHFDPPTFTAQVPAPDFPVAPEPANSSIESAPTFEVAIPQIFPPAIELSKSAELIQPAAAGAMTQTSSQFVRVPIERLDEVVKLISEMIITRTAFEQRMTEFAHHVEELQITGARLRRTSSMLETKYEVRTLGGGRAMAGKNLLAPASGRPFHQMPATQQTHGFDDLEFDRYTEFHLLSRELAEASSDIQTLGRELGLLNNDFLSYLNRQGRIYSELQDRLMRLRMVPLANVAPRLHRTVRTVGAQQHKQVELRLIGETTAIDTLALQEMIDPLLHLLRNAVDHGIELPGERQARGKAVIGTIELRAFYEGSQVVLQLSDDGKGLDAEKIRATAIRNGYLHANEVESMSRQELWSLIFAPGFSTADEVSEISGRGVGMDVVAHTIQKLKGTIVVDSQPGAGTTFTMRLPLTLAVTRSLLIKSNHQTFAIPLDVVTQILRIDSGKIERIGKEPVIRLGGKIYPLLMLGRLLNLKSIADEAGQRPPALMLTVEGKEVVVIVDQLLGGREIVVKTLGSHLRQVHGVMGATLMGDGEVVLILNLAELLRGTTRPLTRRTPTINVGVPVIANSAPMMLSQGTSVNDQTAPPQKQSLTILIVDDSPSVRRVSSNLIKSVGWNAIQAKDGLDALDKLQSGEALPDLVMLDIEMPRMDGYQLLSSLRSLSNFRHLPVVIVSSRSSEKHRQKAFELGANDYLVKPYQDEMVIKLIRQLASDASSKSPS